MAKGWIWKSFRKERTAPTSGLWPTDSELMDYVASGGLSRLDASKTRPSNDDPFRVYPAKSVPYRDIVLHSLKQAFLRGSLGRGARSYTDRYRLTEYCVIPEYWYELTGTCVENPRPKDLDDRNMIVKGDDEPTFLISWRSEQELERSLRRKALLFISLGAIASLFFLRLLPIELGWL